MTLFSCYPAHERVTKDTRIELTSKVVLCQDCLRKSFLCSMFSFVWWQVSIPCCFPLYYLPRFRRRPRLWESQNGGFTLSLKTYQIFSVHKEFTFPDISTSFRVLNNPLHKDLLLFLTFKSAECFFLSIIWFTVDILLQLAKLF